MLKSDRKAISQFILNALSGEDIVLKSAGNQLYSYTYVADAILGLLFILDKGADGEAYNISDSRSDITLKDLAEKIAALAGTRMIMDLSEAPEQAGYSKATKALLDGSKLRALGFEAFYSIEEGLERTIKILREEA
jgi:nucleoside-diphosphate-sugar epimerase